MKSEVSWSDQVPEREDKPKSNAINDLCFSPDGSKLIVAVECRVLVYDAAKGELVNSLRGHKDTVFTVDYAKDGKHFASGGADHTVIIWTSKAEGVLKYTHNESIIRLAYSPGTTKLASCTQFDFGLWRQEQKSVVKHKEDGEVLALGCWDQTLSFYLLSGEQHTKDRKLGFNPCSISYLNGGSYIAIGGSNRKATLCTKARSSIIIVFLRYHRTEICCKASVDPRCAVGVAGAGPNFPQTFVFGTWRAQLSRTYQPPNPCRLGIYRVGQEGVRLATVCETEAWVWALAGRPGHDELVVGCDGGSIGMHKLQFQHVTAIYKVRGWGSLFVLGPGRDFKMRCLGFPKEWDYVEQIAIFRDRLAVRLPDKVHVYELTQHDDKYDLRYRLKDKIYLPSAVPSSSSSALSSASTISSLAVASSNRGSESKEDAARHQGLSSLHSQRLSTGSVDGLGGASRDAGGGGGSSFLLVTWNNVVLCEGRVLQLFDFAGAKASQTCWSEETCSLCSCLSSKGVVLPLRVGHF
ncbi:unnamed protein product [Ectocarpus sp. CCAP 1310/34]|nr:unnamed protein product [Ectocarpus sp. CCAP 1310/34]